MQSAAWTGPTKSNCLLPPVVESSCSWKTPMRVRLQTSHLLTFTEQIQEVSHPHPEKNVICISCFLRIKKAYCAFHWAKLAWACDIHSSHPYSQASKNELQLIMELNYIYWTTLESNHYTYLEKPNSLMLAGWRRTVVATGSKWTRNRKDMAHFHHNTEWLLSAYDPACKQRHSL